MYVPTPRRDEATDDTTPDIVMFSTRWCGDCRRAKRLFDALGVPFTEINIDEDRAAAARVMRLNDGMRSVPTILFPDGSVLVEPSNAALEAKLAAYAGGSR
ncbi:MAG TPA: glutaredoxin family protein [Ktedonobacterales bacterium]|jgi:mycoredoxin|nr:glutaredoxin family protein [Ktedonobacterales bacterium]